MSSGTQHHDQTSAKTELGSKISTAESTNRIDPAHGAFSDRAAELVDVIPLPFRGQLLQPTENPLNVGASGFDDVVRYENLKGLGVVFDPHNLAPSSSPVLTPTFANPWSQFATPFAANPDVVFNSANAPVAHGLTEVDITFSASHDGGAAFQDILALDTLDGAWTAGPDSASAVIQDQSNDFEVRQHLGASLAAISTSSTTVTTGHSAKTTTNIGVDMSVTAHSVDVSTASPHLLGVNLAGAAFGASRIPGIEGTDYIYPTHSEIDYYASKGMDVIRLAFLWERLEPAENGPLSPTELSYIDDVVNYATSKGLSVILDPHNYGYGYGYEIGSAQTPDSAFANFWSQLAGHFANNPNVIFGLMNEPHDQTAPQWLTAVNDAISAIRDAGAVSQEILVPGTHWDGAWTWTTTDNASVIGTGVQDPSSNYAFEVHQYLDTYATGTSSTVVSATIGVERLIAITQWAEATGAKLFLGEFGVASDATSLQALDNMLTYMQEHSSVWQGGTYWAGGPWWGNYMYSIEPHNGVDAPQMGVLDQFAVSTTPPNLMLTGETVSNAQVTLQGTTGEANDAITIFDGSSVLGTTTTGSDGTWSLTTSASNTVHAYTATAVDPWGNVGYSSNEAILAGGSSGITFTFNASAESTPASQDIIAEFNSQHDVIDFTNIAGINASGGLAKFEGKLSGSGNLTLNPHSVAYMETGTNTEVLVNTTSAAETVTVSNISAANIAFVLVGTNLHLTASDFHHG